MIGKAQLVATAPGINDPVLIEVEQVGVVVPVVCLAPPVSLCLVYQLPCVLAQQIALVRLFLHKSIKSSAHYWAHSNMTGKFYVTI